MRRDAGDTETLNPPGAKDLIVPNLDLFWLLRFQRLLASLVLCLSKPEPLRWSLKLLSLWPIKYHS